MTNESFRGGTSAPGRRKSEFKDHRRTAAGSPSAIIAGTVLHDRELLGDIKPIALKLMDPIVATALQCDLDGYPSEIKRRMIEAGLSEAEVEDLWAVTDQAAQQARRRETNRSFKLSPADANRRAFATAQADLIGFRTEENDSDKSKEESFR